MRKAPPKDPASSYHCSGIRFQCECSTYSWQGMGVICSLGTTGLLCDRLNIEGEWKQGDQLEATMEVQVEDDDAERWCISEKSWVNGGTREGGGGGQSKGRSKRAIHSCTASGRTWTPFMRWKNLRDEHTWLEIKSFVL